MACEFLCTDIIKWNAEKVGPIYLNYVNFFISGASFGTILSPKSCDNVCQVKDTDVNVKYLQTLDPKQWKNQDHYAVLGLQTKRHNATEEDIRRAFRKIVLLHHPDKRNNIEEATACDDDYFICITKAYEILGTPKTRRSYDSVDPEFDDSLPTTMEIQKNFYKSFEKYFIMNSRWSVDQNVPSLGSELSSRQNVDNFYNFWYDFNSWREFSYYDEEDKEKGQDREERRWIEKQNKIARIKRKKEEMARIRSLVDLAYNNDPRILKFKEEEKVRKKEAKKAKLGALQAVKAKEELVLQESILAKERADEAEQKRIMILRLAKEQHKKILKRERKILRNILELNNYFCSNEKDRLYHMEGLEKILESLNLLDLQYLITEIQHGGKNVFVKALYNIENKIVSDRGIFNNTNIDISSSKTSTLGTETVWSKEDMQLLVKAVNQFPAGVTQRWDVISMFMNQHSSNKNFIARDVLKKVKSLQYTNYAKSLLKANETAFESFEKNKKKIYNDDANINPCLSNSSNNYNKEAESPYHLVKAKNNKELSSCDGYQSSTQKLWTKEEQVLLEEAIKTFPITSPERWEKIAECLPNRTKKDCLKRVKELVDRVNSKKDSLSSR